MNKILKVRILKCSGINFWYKYSVGNYFFVKLESFEDFKIVQNTDYCILINDTDYKNKIKPLCKLIELSK